MRARRRSAPPAGSCGALLLRLRAVALAGLVFALGACAGARPADSVHRENLLGNNLAVAEAALAAGQPEAARRLYRLLAERFEDAPEPFLGLGHVAFGAGDLSAANHYFRQAAARAGDAPVVKAEALLGAGRAALAAGRSASARRYFAAARGVGLNLPAAAWAANGIAVVATINGDYKLAEARYTDALRLSSGDPRISANLVRMLVAAGKADAAAEIYKRHDASHWLDGDGDALSRLIARQDGPADAPEKSIDPPPRPARKPTAESADAAWDGTLPTPLTLTLGQSRKLALDSDAESVLVAAPDVADVQLLSPAMLYVIGKGIGRTSVAVLGEGGTVRDWIVSVVLDLAPVLAVLAEDPELRGVSARRIARGIALTGKVASPALSERALRLAAAALPENMPVQNELRVTGAQQVNLEVQIAEVQRSVTEELGVNWEAVGAYGDDILGFRVGRLLPVPLAPGARPFPVAAGLSRAADGLLSPGVFVSRTTGSTRVTGMIDALAEAGLANVLARPNITAVSGERASFFSGGEFPVPTEYKDGVIVYEDKKYGVLLDFVPTVIDSGRIVLNVRPEVSERSLNQAMQVGTVTITVINVRRAETTVEVGDGESIVIGGLFRNSSSRREVGVPGLKDVPGLGVLFGHRSVRSEDLELIVIVTARLVTAGAAPGKAGAPQGPRIEGYHY